MPTVIFKNGNRLYIQTDSQGNIYPVLHTGKYPPRGQGYWVDITDAVTACCGGSSTTTTTTTLP